MASTSSDIIEWVILRLIVKEIVENFETVQVERLQIVLSKFSKTNERCPIPKTAQIKRDCKKKPLKNILGKNDLPKIC